MSRNKKHPMRHYGASDDAEAVFLFYKIWHNQNILVRFAMAVAVSAFVGFMTHGVLGVFVGSYKAMASNKNSSNYEGLNVENRPAINICTWNLRGAGDSSDDMSIVATVLQSCDVVAVQELGGKQYKLLAADLGDGYGRTELKSGMAVYFNRSLVHATGRVWMGEGGIKKSFKMNPMVSEYRSGLFKFAITQVDISSRGRSESINEASALDNLVKFALEKIAPEKKLIVTGDFKYLPASVALNALRRKGFANVIKDDKAGSQNIWVNPRETKQVLFGSSAMINIPEIQMKGIRMPLHLPLMVKALVDG